MKENNILLIEDYRDEISHTRETLKSGSALSRVNVVKSNSAALCYLRREGSFVAEPATSRARGIRSDYPQSFE